jgi:hypothetical protein
MSNKQYNNKIVFQSPLLYQLVSHKQQASVGVSASVNLIVAKEGTKSENTHIVAALLSGNSNPQQQQ